MTCSHYLKCNIEKKVFDFKALGTIPDESARPCPCVLTFNAKSLETDTTPRDVWKIAFNLISSKGHQLDLVKPWNKLIPIDQ